MRSPMPAKAKMSPRQTSRSCAGFLVVAYVMSRILRVCAQIRLNLHELEAHVRVFPWGGV